MASVPFKSTAISGSIERTTGDKSYLVAGSNITIVSGSGGQLTISSTGGGGGGTPGGSDTHVQFNSSGGFEGSANLTLNPTGSADSTGLLTLTGSITILSGNTEGGIKVQRGGSSISIGKNSFAATTDFASSKAGNFSHGYGLGGGYLAADSVGAFVQGMSYNYKGNPSRIKAGGFGSFAQGSSLGGYIEASSFGAFAQGRTVGTYHLTASREGSFAQGDAAAGTIAATGRGSFAQGRNSITAINAGSFAQGYNGVGAGGASKSGQFAQGSLAITVTEDGAFAQGYNRVSAEGQGSHAQGKNNVLASGRGSFAQGYRHVLASGGASFAQGDTHVTASSRSSFAQGYGSGPSSQIIASGIGSFAQGDSYIRATADGSFAQGTFGSIASGKGSFARGYAAKGSAIVASGIGSFASAYVYKSKNPARASGAGSFVAGASSGGTLSATSGGAFTHGYAKGGTISTTGVGALAMGYAKTGDIEATGEASVARGFVSGGIMRSSGNGSEALGFIDGSSGLIEASGYGSHASGYVLNDDTSAYIRANGNGSFAHGFVYEDSGPSGIRASGIGATAFGATINNGLIKATGDGSFAVGYSDTFSIIASGYNSSQFGQGENVLKNSLQVGSKSPASGAKGIRIAANLEPALGVDLGDVGDISTQKSVTSPDGTQSPSVANETKFVFSGSIVEKHAGVTNFAVGEFSGETAYFGGGSLTAGKVYYLGSGGNWSVARSDASSAMSGSLLGVALGTGTAAQKGVLLRGFYQLPTTPNTGSYTVGAPMYVATGSTDGWVIDSPPGGTGQVVRIVGHCAASDGLIWFNPDGNFIINS